MDLPSRVRTYVSRINLLGRTAEGFVTNFTHKGDKFLNRIASIMIDSKEEIPDDMAALLPEEDTIDILADFMKF